jgi:hypothetical protein
MLLVLNLLIAGRCIDTRVCPLDESWLLALIMIIMSELGMTSLFW